MRNGNVNFAKYVIVSDSYFFWGWEACDMFPILFCLTYIYTYNK